MRARYDWLDFEAEPVLTGDGSGDPDMYYITIREDEEEMAEIAHRTCRGRFPLDGSVAELKRLNAQRIVDALTAVPRSVHASMDYAGSAQVVTRTTDNAMPPVSATLTTGEWETLARSLFGWRTRAGFATWHGRIQALGSHDYDLLVTTAARQSATVKAVTR